MAESGELRGKISGLILDIDGVVYRGNQALRGAREIFPALRAAGIAFSLLTNNSTQTAEDFSAKLSRMGIMVPPDDILTSGRATSIFLQQNYPQGGGVYVLGEAGLQQYIAGTPGFRLEGWNPDFVVMGLFFGFDYNGLQRACSAVRGGAHFIATNTDSALPVEGGELWPGAGSLVVALQTCSGVEPVVIGKPNVTMAEMALATMGMQAAEVLCVGDRLETDILMGVRAHMPTALVLSGVSKREDVANSPAKPDYIFEDLPDLMAALGIA